MSSAGTRRYPRSVNSPRAAAVSAARVVRARSSWLRRGWRIQEVQHESREDLWLVFGHERVRVVDQLDGGIRQCAGQPGRERLWEELVLACPREQYRLGECAEPRCRLHGVARIHAGHEASQVMPYGGALPAGHE